MFRDKYFGLLFKITYPPETVIVSSNISKSVYPSTLVSALLHKRHRTFLYQPPTGFCVACAAAGSCPMGPSLTWALCAVPRAQAWGCCFLRRKLQGGPDTSRLAFTFCAFASVWYFFLNLFILFIYFWLHWVFVAARAFSSCGKRGLLFVGCMGFSFQWLLLLWSMGSRRAGFSSCGTCAQ